MRAIDETLAARLRAETTTLCRLWRLGRADGVVFGFTDHDRDLAVDGVTYQASGALAADALERIRDGADFSEVESALSSEGLDAEALSAGAWDGATVEAFVYDWTGASDPLSLFSGRLGAVRRGALGFTAQIVGPQAALDAPFGRVFQRFCDAEFGDARCGADAAAYTAQAVVSRVLDPRRFEATGLEGFASRFFTRGRIGALYVVAQRRDAAASIIETDTAHGLSVGDTIAIVAGCDKRHETCVGKFDNARNFRGFPHMPGNDALIAGVDRTQPLDGGSRWRR